MNCSGCANCRSSATQMQSCVQVTRRCSRPEASIASQHLSLWNQLYVDLLSSETYELEAMKTCNDVFVKNLSLHFKIDPPTHLKALIPFVSLRPLTSLVLDICLILTHHNERTDYQNL